MSMRCRDTEGPPIDTRVARQPPTASQTRESMRGKVADAHREYKLAISKFWNALGYNANQSSLRELSEATKTTRAAWLAASAEASKAGLR